MLIPDINMIKPQLLTGILRANEILGDREEVAQIRTVSKKEGKTAQEYLLALQYKEFRTQRHAPDRIFVRFGSPQEGDESAIQEVKFYTSIVPVLKRRLDTSLLRFPICYDGYYDEVVGQYHIILDDISQEFKAARELAPPTPRHREAVMDTLAHFHAVWWEHPMLEELATVPTAESLQQEIQTYQQKFEELDKTVGKYIDARHKAILKKVSEGLPEKRQQRLEAGQGITIIHSDLRPENILHSTMETLIVGWQNWQVGTASDDLAYMIACYWPQHLRKFQEQALLKRYYQAVVAYGVSDYSWEDMQEDYKMSLIHVIGVLLSGWTRKKHASGYWPIMETAMTVFDEMECMEVLE